MSIPRQRQYRKSQGKKTAADLKAATSRLADIVNRLHAGEISCRDLAHVARRAEITPAAFANNKTFRRYRDVAKRYVDRIPNGEALEILQRILDEIERGERDVPCSAYELCQIAGITPASYYSKSPKPTALREAFEALGVKGRTKRKAR